jgi:hypothetical protein
MSHARIAARAEPPEPRTGRFRLDESLLAEVLEVASRIGADAPQTMGRHERALRAVLAYKTRVLGAEHPETVHAADSLVAALSLMREHREALALRRAVAVQREVRRRREAHHNQAKTSAMSTIMRDGHTFHGVGVCGYGVFVCKGLFIETCRYSGQIRDGHACGLGVLERDCGKCYAEYGPDGKIHGRYLYLSSEANGLAGYILFERGVPQDRAWVHHTSEGEYNGEYCAPDDPRILALIARVAPVQASANAASTEAKEAVANLPRRLAGLELMVTVLLARNRQLPTIAAKVAAELLTLQSGLLAMVCEAIMR